MKIFSTILLAGAVTAAFAAEPLLQVTIPRELTTNRYFKKQADGSLLCSRTCYAASRKKIPVDPTKKYRISCEAKGSGNIRIGVSPFTAEGTVATVAGLQPLTGTETVLIAPAAKGDKSFKVKDASKWNIKDARVVYDADMQGRDLPNYNFFGGRVKSISKDADGYLVTMTGAIGIDLPPGACVRQHREGRPAIFGSLRKLTSDWQTFEFILGPGITPDGKHGNKIYPNVTQIASWLSVPQGASIRNLQIEEIK